MGADKPVIRRSDAKYFAGGLRFSVPVECMSRDPFFSQKAARMQYLTIPMGISELNLAVCFTLTQLTKDAS